MRLLTLWLIGCTDTSRHSSFTHNLMTTFREETQILRNTIMDLESFLHGEVQRSKEQLETFRSDPQRYAGLDQLAEKLRSVVQNTSTWQPDPSDPFSFRATIIYPHTDESEHTVACGKLDSGCDENWISSELLTRARLENQVEPTEDQRIYVAFGGAEIEPMGTVAVTWYAVNASKSRKTTFLVHDNVPFDMVLGRIFIKEESIFLFNKPALALRQGKFTKGSHVIATTGQIHIFC